MLAPSSFWNKLRPISGHRFCRNIFTNRNSLHKNLAAVPGLKETSATVKGEVQHSQYPSLDLPSTDVFSYTFRNASKWLDKTYTECGISGRNYTYGQTIDGALRWGAAIKRLLPDIPNPTIGFLCVNTPDFVTLFLGTMAAGAVVTPINPTYTAEEVAFQLKDSNADMLVVDSVFEGLVGGVLKVLQKDLPVLVNGSSSQFGRQVVQQFFLDPNAPSTDPRNVDPTSVAFLPYSSGTTGRPKGVRLTHQAVVSNMCMMISGNFTPACDAEGDHQERQLGILPFFHIFGITATMLCGGCIGSKVITLPKFEPSLFIESIKKHRVTTYQAVPLLARFIAECPMITKEDLAMVHSFVCGAAPLPSDVAKSFKAKAPQAIFQEGYGMTETLITHVTPKDTERIGYCGQLLSNVRAKVVDVLTGDLLPSNTPGELYIQTPTMMSGYHNNELSTRDVIDEDGWFRTGDMVIYTEEGFFSVVDRLKDLIKVKGLQVSPSELEETLEKHPDVSEVGITGVPHSRLGEAPYAFIVKSNPALTEEGVHSHMQKYLAKHKQLLGGIRFVNELPKNQTGKLLRRVLRDMANETH